MINDLKRSFFFHLLFLSLVFLSHPLSLAHSNPLTMAESSSFTATSRYADILNFIAELQRRSSSIRVETLVVSPEGRKVPLLVLGDPVPFSPQSLKYDPRGIVYIQANIHAGEVEGKEASLMLARDILLKKTPFFFDRLVILIAPVFNADGNEKIDTKNRRNQSGPEKGVGVRHNGQNLDLNRDSMKLESPELRGLVQNVLMRWDPFLLVDCHTTNGSYHEEPVTYAWPFNPNGDLSIIVYMREKMLPVISAHLKDKYNTLSIPYGNFMDFRNPEKGWRTFSPHPRFVTNYIGLRNRLSILDENYAYADYKIRVLSCYKFLLSILEYCYINKDEITRLVREADRKTIQRGYSPAENDFFAVEFEVNSLKEPVTVLGWEMELIPGKEKWPRVRKTDTKRTYTLPYYADFIPERKVRFPFAYLYPESMQEITEKLLQHGIVVEKLSERAVLEVESFRIKEIKGNERLYQGHRMNSVKGEYVVEKRKFPEGTIFIPTAQNLGSLAAYLLEPESNDGLLAWNFFDRYLVTQWQGNPRTYPVYRLLKPIKIPRETQHRDHS